MLKAIIFDFDGTILDTETPDFECWSSIFREHGHELELDRYVACIGTGHHAFNPYTHLEEVTGKTLFHDDLRARHQELFSELIVGQPVLPGIIALVETARDAGLKVAVASSSERRWVQGHLERLGLVHYFEAILTSDDVERIKPAPDLYLAALRALEVEAHEAMAVEDSLNGVRAAKAANLYCVAVPNSVTRGLCFDEADECLASLADYKLKLERMTA